MPNFTYLQDRGGIVHVWDDLSPSKRDPWLRAICGDPGDFHRLIKYDGAINRAITCQSCKRKLGIPVQMSLFKQ